jgi:hypothetical protein
MITKLWEKGRPKCEAYFPHGEPGTCEATAGYADVNVTVRSLTHRDGYTIRELLVQVGFTSLLPFYHMSGGEVKVGLWCPPSLIDNYRYIPS